MKPIRTTHRSGQLHWVHWLIVLFSLFVTIITWYISSTHAQQKVKGRFESQSSQLLSLVAERMASYEDVLRSGVAALHLQGGGVGQDSWRRFVDKLELEKRYSGMNGIGIVFYLKPDGVSDFLEKEHQFRPDFTIHPVHNEGEHWPITYIEPIESNMESLGLDLAFEANRFTTAKKARDTGRSQITAPITLVQNKQETPGFLQFVPFYSRLSADTFKDRQQYFSGHVYAPFIMAKLIEGTLKQENRQLLFNVYDEGSVLYDELQPDNPEYDSEPLYSKELVVETFGRPWRFTIQTSISFRESARSSQSFIILIGGVIIGGLLLLLFYMLSRFNQQAVAIARRMTHKLTVSEEYFRHIIDAAPCGIFVMNVEGEIELVNPQAVALFGYSEMEFRGKSIDTLVPHRFRGKHPEYRKSFAAASTQRRRMGIGREIFGLARGGREFPAEIGLAQFKGETGIKTLATVMDMTEHFDVTSALKRSNKALNDFAYVASHDLKAPLRGIQQLAGWIEEEVEQELTDEVKEYFGLLNGRVSRLNTLLDDLLAFSRVGRKHGDFNAVELESWMQGIYDILAPPKEFSFTCTSDIESITTLVVPLELVIRNLINNAIKHHDRADGCISVECRLESPDFYRFTVRDDGPGIPNAQQDKVFEIFQTLKPRDQVEGSGMGLAVVKRTLETYQGHVILESDGESGCCFSFSWPVESRLRGMLSGRA